MSGEEPAAAAWRARHTIALVLLALLALALLIPFRGYLTDDTFIHLQFAKHLLRGEGFSFNAGEPTYGATSPLWVLLLAGTGSFVPGAEATPPNAAILPPLAAIAKAYGALFTALAVLAMAGIARALGWDPASALAAAALLAVHAWSIRWGVSGMETPLALALGTLSFLLLARLLRRGGTPIPAGIALGAAALARPEFLLLLALAAGAVAWASAPGRRIRRAGALLAGALLPLGPWLLAAWRWFHRLLPNTSAAKAGSWLDPERTATALRESIRILLAADAVPVLLAVWALAWLRPWSAVGAGRGRRAFWAVALAWPLLLVGTFAMTGVQVVSRYLVPVAPAVILIGLGSLRLAMRGRPARFTAALLVVVALAATEGLFVTFRLSAPHAVRHTEGLRASLAEIGLWARARTKPGTLIAAADIGAFGYYSDRPVLDLYGLVTPRLAPVVVREGYDAVVWNLLFEPAGRPAYLVDRNPVPGRLEPPDDPTSPYRFLFARQIPDLGITRPAPYSYSVYSIDWNLYDKLHPRVAEGSEGGRACLAFQAAPPLKKPHSMRYHRTSQGMRPSDLAGIR